MYNEICEARSYVFHSIETKFDTCIVPHKTLGKLVDEQSWSVDSEAAIFLNIWEKINRFELNKYPFIDIDKYYEVLF